MNCMQCHSLPQWGVAGYAVSRLMKPMADALDRINLPAVLWHLHFLACFLGLAYLPFSKMFHIFASPLSLMVNAVMDRSTSAPANIATKHILELDACTHCGACTQRCSVAVVFGEIPNVNILPSEKIASLKVLAAGKSLSSPQLRTIQQGLFLCTNCNRCSLVCPVGIGLRDLWVSAREVLLQKSLPESLLLSPFSLYRGLRQELIGQAQYQKPIDLTKKALSTRSSQEQGRNPPASFGFGDKALLSTLRASIQANSFSSCCGCMTCSNSCPVVRNYRKPGDVLGLMPHQLMYAIGLRQWDLVFESMMLWDCLGCYQCQENCPQNVQVTEILYELKNLAVSRVDEKSA
jgi:heterodisulfide reductase subunit C